MCQVGLVVLTSICVPVSHLSTLPSLNTFKKKINEAKRVTSSFVSIVDCHTSFSYTTSKLLSLLLHFIRTFSLNWSLYLIRRCDVIPEWTPNTTIEISLWSVVPTKETHINRPNHVRTSSPLDRFSKQSTHTVSFSPNSVNFLTRHSLCSTRYFRFDPPFSSSLTSLTFCYFSKVLVTKNPETHQVLNNLNRLISSTRPFSSASRLSLSHFVPRRRQHQQLLLIRPRTWTQRSFPSHLGLSDPLSSTLSTPRSWDPPRRGTSRPCRDPRQKNNKKYTHYGTTSGRDTSDFPTTFVVLNVIFIETFPKLVWL